MDFGFSPIGPDGAPGLGGPGADGATGPSGVTGVDGNAILWNHLPSPASAPVAGVSMVSQGDVCVWPDPIAANEGDPADIHVSRYALGLNDCATWLDDIEVGDIIWLRDYENHEKAAFYKVITNTYVSDSGNSRNVITATLTNVVENMTPFGALEEERWVTLLFTGVMLDMLRAVLKEEVVALVLQVQEDLKVK